MIKDSSKLLLTMLSLFALVLLAVLVLGVYDIQRKNKEASALLHLADKATRTRVLAQSIEAAQENASGDLAAFDSLTLSSDKLVPLIDSIEAAGRMLNLDTDIVSVDRTEGKGSSEPDIIHIVIEAQGPWAQALSFLRAIESLPHRVVIEGSNLARAEVGWRLRVALSLYSFD
ncbi:MAG: hypothetical protein WD896_00050 [Parcubacteria group bacterium]